MYIYNVTIKVREDIQAVWMEWLQAEHIPEILATGCFYEATILQLLEIDDTEGPTFAIQYKAESKAQYNHYITKYADSLRQKSFEKWGDAFIAFRSIMKVVN